MMKKLVIALAVGLMVMATASMAAAEITVGGELEIRYDIWNNLDLNRAFDEQHFGTHSQNFFADRILLNVDAKITEGLEAYVELATDSAFNENEPDERVWGFNHTTGDFVSATNHHGELFAVRQAWINFMIPGLPAGVKIGHQPLALGHGIFLNSQRMGQDAILLYAKPIPELLLAGVYVKAWEGSSGQPGILNNSFGNEHQDVDIYAALANYTFMPNNTAGVFYLYGHDMRSGAFDPTETVAYLHDIGVIADGVVGPVNYKMEVDYQNINADLDLGDGNKNHSFNNSWAFMLGAGAKVAMVNVGAEVAYGTGSTEKHGVDPEDPTHTGDRTYINPYGTTSYNYAFLYNDKIGQGPLGTGGGFGLGDGTGGFGLANTGYIKVSVGMTPMEKLNMGLDFLYLRASESSFSGQSKDLGWEVDAHADYKIYDNLNLNVTGGVFVPGAWYAFNGQVSSADTVNTFPVGKGVIDVNDPTSSLKRNVAYGLETKLTVKF